MFIEPHLWEIFLQTCLSFENECFPDNLKLAKVSPIFKENDDLDKENYRSVSVSFNVSKVSERIIYSQTNVFLQDKLSNLLTGFRKNHSAQHSLMYRLKIWIKILHKGGYACVMFMDSSKAFDTIQHDLMIAKLGAYGFSHGPLHHMGSYWINRQKRARANSNFSTWEIIIAGVSQGSILGPVLFKIFISDLFRFVWDSHLSNYADDNTLYAFGYNTEKMKILRFNFELASKWFEENHMVLNAGKYHFMYYGKNTENETFIFNSFIFNNSNKENILGTTIDNKLTFKSHIKILCEKATQKIGTLSRLLNYLNDF